MLPNPGVSVLNMRAVRCLEMSGSEYPLTKRQIPEERKPQIHRCENLATRVSSLYHCFVPYEFILKLNAVPVQVLRAPGGSDPQSFYKNLHITVTGLSAPRNDRPYPPGDIPDTHFC